MTKFSYKPTIVYALLMISILSLNVRCKKDGENKTGTVYVNWKQGDIFYDKEHWTACIVGDMPLVISIPHGGTEKPGNISDRSCSDIVTVTDLNTIELARAISRELADEYNLHPYLVLCNLKRTKIDQNREIKEATCGNKAMEAPWHLFHDYIDTALTEVVGKFGSALYIDLHGHGHANQRIEIGYSMSKNDLSNVYTKLNLEALWHKSSLNNLHSIKNGQDFRARIIGDKAFGTMMGNEGIRAVPSEQDPYPTRSEPFFSGGYNTGYYSSSNYPRVFGWQIECNNEGVRDTEASRIAFSKAFVKVIMQYLQDDVGYKP